MKLDSLRARLLDNPDVRREYEALGPEYALRSALIKLRQKRGLTQTQMAARLGTVQSVVSRLEAGSFNPRMSTLKKLAEVLDAEIVIASAGPRLIDLVERRRKEHPVRPVAAATAGPKSPRKPTAIHRHRGKRTSTAARKAAATPASLP